MFGGPVPAQEQRYRMHCAQVHTGYGFPDCVPTNHSAMPLHAPRHTPTCRYEAAPGRNAALACTVPHANSELLPDL